MNSILARLIEQRDRINTAISVLEQFSRPSAARSNETPLTAHALRSKLAAQTAKAPKGGKRGPYKARRKRTKPHWTQTAAGKARLSASLKAFHARKAQV